MKLKSCFFICCFLLLNSLAIKAQEWQMKPNSLVTEWGEQVTPENAWHQYPRPQLKREKWENLNGLWDYAITKRDEPIPAEYEGQILVPFCVESALSGVKRTFLPDDRLYYRREFTIPKGWEKDDILLNFDAVDWTTFVWVNGVMVGSHKGAYDRFTFNITPYLKESGKQEIVVAVDDPTSAGSQARGKQRLLQKGIWYTPVSGIWQTVWLEAVSNEAWVKELSIMPDIDKSQVKIVPLTNRPLGPSYKIKVEVSKGNQVIATKHVASNKQVNIPLEKMRLWSPDDPFLYDLHISLLNKEGQVIDHINSYFGMRKISVGTIDGLKYIFLNDEKFFQYGTLDQGWWPDGLYTPPSEEAMVFDIVKTKEMGFNMIRKHVKVEPDLWYYHCDKIGMLVWQDMPSGMTIGPSEGDRKPTNFQHVGGGKKDLFKSSESATQFELELRRMIVQHYNAPSIVTWVPLNEGWGQYATERLAQYIKDLDPTRLVNPVSGWSLRPVGDIHDIHTYGKKVRVPPLPKERASAIGEFGGIGYPVKGHLWNPEMRNWGYQTYKSADALLENYIHKFNQIVEMKNNSGLSAAVYTQTTDVEGEVNGLMTYDRKVIKIPVKKLKKIHAALNN